MSRRAYRKDANHGSVGDFIRAHGWSVLDLAQHGVSVDFVVAKYGWACLLEVKDGSKPPSDRQLTPKEKALRDQWDGPYVLAESPEEALSKLNAGLVRDGRCKLEDLVDGRDA